MTEYSPAATRWLQEFSETERLHKEIFSALQTEKSLEEPDAGESEAALTELIHQQDKLIHQLPFEQLSIDDVVLLKSQIDKLQTNHHTLVEAISFRRQSLLDQSSQNKKAKRSIKAYQQAQDL